MIKLRKLEMKDAQGMLEWMHDSDSKEYFTASVLNKQKEEVEEFIKISHDSYEEEKNIHLAIVNEEEDEYLGTISLKNISKINKNAEMAIVLSKQARGKGVASEAVDLMLTKAFNKYNLEKVYLNVLTTNRNAISLYEKKQFIFEGEFKKHININDELRDLRWYGILRENYQ